MPTTGKDLGFVLPSQCQDNPEEPCDTRITSCRHPETWCRVCRSRVLIGKLEAENARLRATLERIAHNMENGESFSGTQCADIAREALGCERDDR